MKTYIRVHAHEGMCACGSLHVSIWESECLCVYAKEKNNSTRNNFPPS